MNVIDPGGRAHDATTWSRPANVMDEAVRRGTIVGAVVLVALNGAKVFDRAVGYSHREHNTAMTADAIFRLSSLTKPIVTTAAMALLERNVLALDDVVTRWLPNFQPVLATGEAPPITVRQLLTHQAGLSYAQAQPPGGPYDLAAISDGLDQPGLTMDEELQRLASVPLFFPPGSNWGYSLAMDVLGEVLSRASGEPLPRLVERLVTEPLAMGDTAFVIKDEARLAAPYVDGDPPRLMRDPDSVATSFGSDIRFAPSRIFDARSFVSGGAGMAGTASDFLKLLEALRQGGRNVVSRETARAMMNNQIGALRINVEPTPSWGFGYGGAVLMDPELAGSPHAAGTWKWAGIYGHHWYVDPANKLSVVALSNTAIAGFAGPYVDALKAAVYETLAELKRRDR